MLIIEHGFVEENLKQDECIKIMRKVLISLANGDAKQIVRPVLPLYQGNVMGMMPAFIESENVAGVKILSVFPKNYEVGKPSHQGQILLFDTYYGEILGLVDAESITGIRTAAISAVGTDALAKKDANTLAILGAGLQGRKHLEAISKVRNIKKVYVWDLHTETANKYAKEMSELMDIEIVVCTTTKEACKDADIVCTLTPSKDPIIFLEDIKPGAHINAVGACTPKARELSSDLIAKSKLFVDWTKAINVESGDYLIPLSEGVINEDHIVSEIGRVLDGTLEVPYSEEDITVFKALGQASSDIVVANHILKIAKGEN